MLILGNTVHPNKFATGLVYFYHYLNHSFLSNLQSSLRVLVLQHFTTFYNISYSSKIPGKCWILTIRVLHKENHLRKVSCHSVTIAREA